jgi:hypothetical protein
MMPNTIHLETMNLYIEAGRFLTDFDRNNTFDLKELLRFFEPNNRLFGDYEVRKKNKYEDSLNAKNRDGITDCKIPRKDIEAGGLLLFVISGTQLFVEYGGIAITRNQVGKVTIDVNEKAKKALSIDPSEVRQLYVLDPVKLKQICHLDKARNIAFKKALLEQAVEKFYGLNEGLQTLYCEVVEEVVQGKIAHQDDAKILEMLSLNSKYKEIAKDILNNIITIFNSNDDTIRPLIKLKNFEEFKEVTIRLGIYQDGRYVIYLHPYKSESNCPGRIPSE